MRARRAGTAPRRIHGGESHRRPARRRPGAVGHSRTVPYRARSPVRRLGAEHARRRCLKTFAPQRRLPSSPPRNPTAKRTEEREMRDTGFRTEKDSLGEMQVPADALYAAQTQRAVENFPISGIRFPRRFLRALGLVKAVAAAVNQDLGLLDERRARAIQQAAREVVEGRWDDQFPIDI